MITHHPHTAPSQPDRRGRPGADGGPRRVRRLRRHLHPRSPPETPKNRAGHRRLAGRVPTRHRRSDVVVILDVIVATALYILFAPVNRMVWMIAAGFRIAYAAVYLVAIAQLVIAVNLLGSPAQALLAVNAYDTIWNVD